MNDRSIFSSDFLRQATQSKPLGGSVTSAETVVGLSSCSFFSSG